MYALVDCNNFYCSCERVFNPSLIGRPIIVLSNNDGCAVARSDEAKAAGIAMGTPVHTIDNLIRQHNVAVFSSNYTLYGDMSDRVMKILGSFVPRMELYSIDEAFLDVSQLPSADLVQLGVNMRKKVITDTGIPVTIGIAPTKALAKLANRFAKKNYKSLGVHWLANDQLIKEALDNTLVGDVWGVGRQHAALLTRHGIQTAQQLATASEEWIRKHLSVVGLRLIRELNGISAMDWEAEPKRKKNLCVSRSFSKLAESKDILTEALSNFAGICAGNLRKDKSCAKKIEVFINTNPHRPDQRQYAPSITIEMDVATNNTAEIIKYALKGLDIIYKPGHEYLKAGIIARDIVPEESIQYSLFDLQNRGRGNKLMDTLDNLNRSLGKDIVRYAVQGFEKRYRMKQEWLSQRYTTNINEVLHVKN